MKKNKVMILREIFFILIALLFILPMLIRGFIPQGDDWVYQMDRVLEISYNIHNGNFFPIMYTYSFKKIGYLLGAFYPWVTLIPFAILKNLISNQVTAIALGFTFYIFISLNLTYHVSNKLFKNKIQALLTSVVYVFSGYVLVDCYRRMALGEFLAMMFLPVAFYGFYEVLFGDDRKWPYLALGMSAIMLSHVLTTFIISVTFIILLLFLFHWISNKKNRIIHLGYSIIVFITSSAIFLFPFLEQEKYQKFNQPSPVPLQGQNFGDLIIQSLNGMDYSLGTLIILTLFFGILFWNNLDKIEKASYIIGTVALVISSSLFPWVFFDKTPFSLIQYPFRILMIVTIFYSIVLGKVGKLAYYGIFIESKNKLFSVVIILVAILIPWLGSAMNYIDVPISVHNPGSIRFTKNYKVNSNKELRLLWLNQYTPKNGESYLNNVIQGNVIVDGTKMTLKGKDIKSKPNTLEFKNEMLDNASSLDLPVFNYKNVYVFRGNKKINWKPGAHDTVTINTPGIKGPVTVKYIPSFVDKLGIILSIMTWVIVLLLIGLDNLKRFSN